MIALFSDRLFIELADGFKIHFLGIILLLVVLFSWGLLRWVVMRQKIQIKSGQLLDFLLVTFLISFLSARFFYGLFSDSEIFYMFKPESPYWGFLDFKTGGFSFYGAVLGVLLSCSVFAFVWGVNRLYLLDLSALICPFVIFVGFIGCYFNGDFKGWPVEESQFLSVKYWGEVYDWTERRPEKLQIFAESSEVNCKTSKARWLDIVKSQEEINKNKDFILNCLNLIMSKSNIPTISLAGLIEGTPSGDLLEKRLIEKIPFRFPLQICFAIFEGLFVFMVVMAYWRKPKKSGTVFCLFVALVSIGHLLFVGISHIAIEKSEIQSLEKITQQTFANTSSFLQLDHFINVVAFFTAVIFYMFWSKRESLPMPGWGKANQLRIYRRY